MPAYALRDVCFWHKADIRRQCPLPTQLRPGAGIDRTAVLMPGGVVSAAPRFCYFINPGSRFGGTVRAALSGALMLSATTLELASVNAVVAQTLNDLKCTGNPDIPWDQQIVGCTNAIKSGRYTGKDLAAANQTQSE